MSWIQVLTDHTKPSGTAGEYVETKTMSTELYNKTFKLDIDWGVSVVGTFMHTRISHWDDANNICQTDVLDAFQDARGIRLFQYGSDFYEMIHKKNIAGARKYYEEIKSIMERINDDDIDALANLLIDYVNSGDYDCDGDCGYD